MHLSTNYILGGLWCGATSNVAASTARAPGSPPWRETTSSAELHSRSVATCLYCSGVVNSDALWEV